MFVIINITAPLLPDRFGDECIIPENRRPTYVHETRQQAENEALRLAQTHGGKFAILGALAFTEEKTAYVPTKVWTLTETQS
jgi:hypothetical protein